MICPFLAASFLMIEPASDFKGKWQFKSGKSLFCATVTFKK